MKTYFQSPQPLFGASVSLSPTGDALVVGALGEASNATYTGGNQADMSAWKAGAAYLFTRGATGWSQRAYVKPSDTTINEQFGTSVGIAGDTKRVPPTRRTR